MIRSLGTHKNHFHRNRDVRVTAWGIKRISQAVRIELERDFLDCAGLIPKISNALLECEAVDVKRTGPLATYLFIGPTATGKSVAVACMREALTQPRRAVFALEDPKADLVLEALGLHPTPAEGGSTAAVEKWACKVFDLSAYTGHNQNFALVGLSAGYTDAKPGELTSFIRVHPRALIVMDHLDRAHPNTQTVLTEMFESGVLTDRYGFYTHNDFKQEAIAPPEVDVSQCIFVFTCSLDDEISRNDGFFDRYAAQPGQGTDTLLDYLRKQRSRFDSYAPAFDSGLLSALAAQTMLLFPPLREAQLKQLVKRNLEQMAQNFQRINQASLGFQANADLLVLASLLAHGADLDPRRVGARALRELWLPEIEEALQGVRPESARPEQVDIGFQSGTLDALEPILRRLGAPHTGQDDPAHDLTRCLRRRNRAVVFQRRIEKADGHWKLVLHTPQITIPQRAEDFLAKAALITEVPSVRFDDVQGHVVVKERLREILALLKHPERIEQLGAAAPSGMLLYGPPGTGKTLLAKALASEADLPFIAANGVDLLYPEFTEQLYARARHYAPSLVFLDEIDVLGSREHGGSSAAINALLTQIDGFGDKHGTVFTVAATNYLHRLDPALLRPGRLGLHIEVPLLDREARRGFIARFGKLPGGDTLDIDALVEATTGLSGAELQAIGNEAAYAIARDKHTTVSTTLLLDLINTERFGPRVARPLSAGEKQLTALHEAGHAVVAQALIPERRIEQISIVPRQRMLGVTVFSLEDEAPRIHTRAAVIHELAVMLAGRAAQRLLAQDAAIDSGAGDDIHRATELALMAAARWALDPDAAPLDYTCLGEGGQWRSDTTVRAGAEALLREAQHLAQQTVEAKKQDIQRLAARLVIEEVVRFAPPAANESACQAQSGGGQLVSDGS